MKPHLSASQMASYCRCPEAYRRAYIEGERIPPAVAMLTGSAFHACAETNMSQKLESHVDLPIGDIVDAAVAAFESRTHDGYSLAADEESRGPKIVLGEATDAVVKLATVHAVEQAPDYQPVFVEERFRIELPGPRDLVGIIDVADDRNRVIDFKTSAKKKNQGEADSSVQLTVYAAGHHAITGEPPSEVRLDVAVNRKSGTERQVLNSQRGPDDFEALAARINVISSAIDAGIFPPTNPDNWQCSEKWCGYFTSCAFTSKRETKTFVELTGPKMVPTEAPGTVDVETSEPKPTKRKKRYTNIRTRLLSEKPNCHWCGCKLAKSRATIDHVVPLAQGGTNDESNLVLSCSACNGKRGDTGLTPEDARP